MSKFSLTSDLHVAVTPAGAYYAATASPDDPSGKLLIRLLSLPHTPQFDSEGMQQFQLQPDDEAGLEILYRVQEIGWVVGSDLPKKAPEFNMERDIPHLLASLSGDGKALLADAHGFHLANVGFVHEVVEELSAVAADVASMQQRHQLLIRNNLRINTTGWGAVDAAGNSQIGFWPLQVSEHVFVLAIAGIPKFNQQAFTELVWWLFRRYAGLT